MTKSGNDYSVCKTRGRLQKRKSEIKGLVDRLLMEGGGPQWCGKGERSRMCRSLGPSLLLAAGFRTCSEGRDKCSRDSIEEGHRYHAASQQQSESSRPMLKRSNSALFRGFFRKPQLGSGRRSAGVTGFRASVAGDCIGDSGAAHVRIR